LLCCRCFICAVISTGDFQEALAALLGKDAPNLSPTTALIKDRAIRLQQRREELQAILDSMEESPVLFHPNMAGRYQKELLKLHPVMGNDGRKDDSERINPRKTGQSWRWLRARATTFVVA
jgi:hypothetical protein